MICSLFSNLVELLWNCVKVGGGGIYMEVVETIQCPYCGQSFGLAIDTSTASQQFTTDCEVCCRPFEVVVECEPGEVLSLEVQGG